MSVVVKDLALGLLAAVELRVLCWQVGKLRIDARDAREDWRKVRAEWRAYRLERELDRRIYRNRDR